MVAGISLGGETRCGVMSVVVLRLCWLFEMVRNFDSDGAGGDDLGLEGSGRLLLLLGGLGGIETVEGK